MRAAYLRRLLRRARNAPGKYAWYNEWSARATPDPASRTRWTYLLRHTEMAPHGRDDIRTVAEAERWVRDLLEAESESRFLAEAARGCMSCPQCSDVPCGACTAGGICDRLCHCEKDEW